MLGNQIGFAADPSHGLKGTMNALRNQGTIQLSKEEVEQFNLISDKVHWQAILDLVELQKDMEHPINKKLNEGTIKRCSDHFGKMDVQASMQIFHKDTAAGISFMVDSGKYPREYLTTAHFVWQVAHWYEIMSARYVTLAFSYKNMEKFDEQVAWLKSFMRNFIKMIISGRQRVSAAKGTPGAMETVQKSILLSGTTTLWLVPKILADPEVEFYPAGRGLGDPVESHNGVMRMKGKNPTPLQVKRFSKIICISQLMCRIMGSNVPPDDAEFLTEFKYVKKMKEVDKSEDAEDIETFIEVEFNPGDFSSFEDYSERNSLSSFAGYVLWVTIMTKSKCDTCKNALVDKNENNDQHLNNLIVDKSWGNSKRVRPTKLGNEIFHVAELIFKEVRDKYYNQKNIRERLVNFIHRQILHRFESSDRTDEIPMCHLRLILTRFMKGRLFFWADFMNKNDKNIPVNIEMENEESFASKSTRSTVIPQLK